jgi:hypothetical protein
VRVLFFVDRPGVLRQFASLVEELAARGHDVHLALRSEPDEDQQPQVERLVGASPHVTSGPAPARGQGDGWRPVAWAVRALADLARYAHPRYAHSPTLRARVTKKVVRRLERASELEPAARGLALRLARRLVAGDFQLAESVIRTTAKLERAIPSSAEIDRYVRDRAPDVVLATSVVKLASPQVEFLKSARTLGIPAATLVASWDNLTNKGLLKWQPEQVFVWNELQRQEAIELHGMQPERVTATGAALFDAWFDRRPSTEQADFVRGMGLDPERPYVLFLGSSPFVTNHSDDEVRFVERWLEALRASPDERVRLVGIAVRPHPVGKGWRGADLSRFENAAIWPRHSERPVSAEEHDTFFDQLAHSAAVVGINTTAMIEAAVVGKSVLTVLAPEFGQESTLHFHYLREENGGFLHVASSLDEHSEQLGRVLEDRADDAGQRRRFVESFVRPHGLDRPATPIFADAVERLASAPVAAQAAGALLRPLLAVEAALAGRRLARGPRPRGGALPALESRPEPQHNPSEGSGLVKE